ncbi:MAG: [Fe-Fe] hydrogenase large subunit C-terminal domain-containing protein [Acutalibacteraceae bacterium]
MSTYEHSVSLQREKCTGCTTCLRHCPTEAIRIRDCHAVIAADRCIDCGECIRVCPHNAKRAECNKLDNLSRFKWRIALPAPSLYGQFEGLEDADHVIQGLLDMGFDDVCEVSAAAEYVSEYTRLYLKTEGIKRPVISSACPVVSRLIAMRFPYLKDNLLPLLPPMELAAAAAREKALAEHPEFVSSDIGVCFISPCPAKTSYVKNGFGDHKSGIDLVVSISDIYFTLINLLKSDKPPKVTSNSGMIGISWAASGGEATALFNDRYLAADGIENVIKMLDQIENGTIPQLEFIELNACTGGCVGGVMTVENPFIAKARLQTLRRYLPVSQNILQKDERYIPSGCFFGGIPDYSPLSQLGSNIAESMRMMADIQSIKEQLPGIDCGSCGAPNCRALAEDIVKGESTIDACVIRRYKCEGGGTNDSC